MCVSSRSSLVLFLSGCIGSFALVYKRKDLKYIGLMFIIMMQFAEYLMWIDIESGGHYPSLNIIGNYIGILSLFLQTCGLILLMPRKHGIFMFTINLVYYVIVTVLYTNLVYKKEKEDEKNRNSSTFQETRKAETLQCFKKINPPQILCVSCQ